jgi:uncharacterized membrane protein YgdD (TMEM256/DUF423 family)
MITSLRLRLWLFVAGLSGACAVASEAFARHGLDAQADAYAIQLVNIASKYQGLYAVLLILILLLGEHIIGARFARGAILTAGWAFTAGLVLFCGVLEALALGAPPSLTPIVPIGGTAFILGWLALAVAGLIGNR